MASLKWLSTVLIVAGGLSLWPGDLHAQRPSKAPKSVSVAPSENFGYVSPPIDVKGLRPYAPAFLGRMAPPPSWDWRALGGVTSVKNQNPYGTCWAFAAIGDLESKVLINEAATYDYSELNIVACVPYGVTCNTGGNAWMTTNYLALLGSVYESCNPYPGACPTPACVNPACAFYKRVTEWRLIPKDILAIKNAIMTYGPVYSAMYASFPGFGTYSGGCLVYTGVAQSNHAVLIVGWDDSMCGGQGAWIVKNSWGTSWGVSGYFYIRYDSANIGEDASVITAYKVYNSSEKIYYFDEWGWWGSVGWGDGDDCGMVAITPTGTPPEGDLLKAVDFWATWAPCTYTIEIFDTFSGGVLSTRLAGPFTGAKSEAGYYSFELPAPLSVYAGNTIYIKIRFQTPGYDWPIPYDDSGPMETNKCYVSNNGTSWEALDSGNYEMGDVGIRARVEPRPVATSCSREGDPALRYGWGQLDGLPYNQPGPDYASLYPGQSVTYQLGPYNAHPTWLPEGCKNPDTLCCHVDDSKGWTITGAPALETATIVDPGYLWYQDVTITVPCDVALSDNNTVIVTVGYTDVNGVCAPDCVDCNDPNIRPASGVRYYSADTLVITVVEAPPALAILQDTLTLVERGQIQAYVPFAVCNQDECAPPTLYGYNIKSKGHVGPAINTTGATTVAGGECNNVYGIIDASSATACAYDTLKIVVWTTVEPYVYDTCVQVIHVVEPSPVPLMTPTVVAILVLALILIAAVFMRRRMGSKK